MDGSFVWLAGVLGALHVQAGRGRSFSSSARSPSAAPCAVSFLVGRFGSPTKIDYRQRLAGGPGPQMCASASPGPCGLARWVLVQCSVLTIAEHAKYDGQLPAFVNGSRIQFRSSPTRATLPGSNFRHSSPEEQAGVFRFLCGLERNSGNQDVGPNLV